MYRVIGHYPIASLARRVPEMEQRLAHGPWECWLEDGYTDPSHSDDDDAMNGDSLYRFE